MSRRRSVEVADRKWTLGGSASTYDQLVRLLIPNTEQADAPKAPTCPEKDEDDAAHSIHPRKAL